MNDCRFKWSFEALYICLYLGSDPGSRCPRESVTHWVIEADNLKSFIALPFLKYSTKCFYVSGCDIDIIPRSGNICITFSLFVYLHVLIHHLSD